MRSNGSIVVTAIYLSSPTVPKGNPVRFLLGRLYFLRMSAKLILTGKEKNVSKTERFQGLLWYWGTFSVISEGDVGSCLISIVRGFYWWREAAVCMCDQKCQKVNTPSVMKEKWIAHKPSTLRHKYGQVCLWKTADTHAHLYLFTSPPIMSKGKTKADTA